MTVPRLHVDVTHLFDRPYRPTGITRIIIELARAAREVAENVDAWRYDWRRDGFRRVKWSEIEQIAGLGLEENVSTRPSAWRRLGGEAVRLCWRNRIFRFIDKMLYRSAIVLLGSSGLPRFSETDLFIFADILDEDRKLAAYGRLIESSGVHVLFYCHDVIPLKFSSFATEKLRAHFRSMIELFSGAKRTTICNSETTSKDLQDVRARMGLANGPPIVVLPGSDFAVDESVAEASRAELPETPYILYVSTVEIRKNHRVLLEAYDTLIRDPAFDPPQLVFVGQKGWLVDELLQEIDELSGPGSYLTMMTNVSDDLLSQLYKGASFSVYPSLYEGWGIPVSESLHHGKFCICSDRGALSEVGGEFVEYLDPENSDQWAQAIKHYVLHPSELLERERRIMEEFTPRRWSDFRREAGRVFLRATGRS